MFNGSIQLRSVSSATFRLPKRKPLWSECGPSEESQNRFGALLPLLKVVKAQKRLTLLQTRPVFFQSGFKDESVFKGNRKADKRILKAAFEGPKPSFRIAKTLSI